MPWIAVAALPQPGGDVGGGAGVEPEAKEAPAGGNTESLTTLTPTADGSGTG